MLGRGTLAVILLMAGAMGLADASEGIDIGPEGYLAAALIVTGAGLVVGAWWGRARWLILLGAFLALSLGAAAKFDVPLRGGFGERFHRPTDFSEVDRNYRLFAGEMHLDFSEVDFPRGVTEIDASVAFGELHVRIPQDVTVIVTAEAHAGEVHVLGESDQGLGSEARRMVRGPRGSGTVRLDLEVGGGEIEVRRGAA